MAGLPYRLYGGATRPDAISGLDPAFSQALLGLYQAAPPAVQAELGLNSAYRSAAVQQGLWDRSDKTGHTVARPGRSKHQAGTAADLYGFGLSGSGSVSDATRNWVKANAEAHGLYFPMSYEPWHIQLQGQGQGAPASSGGVAETMASAVDPRSAVMGMMENNPWKAITDSGPKRGGLVGDGSAGGGLTAAPTADPGIPPMENVSAVPQPAIAASPSAPSNQIGQLASLFKIGPIGQAGLPKPPPHRRA